MPLAKDLLHPSPAEEKRKHKLKRLVQHPNSYFMDVKCPGCYRITTVFSHAQSVVVCAGCSTILCQPTGGRARLTEGKCIACVTNPKVDVVGEVGANPVLSCEIHSSGYEGQVLMFLQKKATLDPTSAGVPVGEAFYSSQGYYRRAHLSKLL